MSTLNDGDVIGLSLIVYFDGEFSTGEKIASSREEVDEYLAGEEFQEAVGNMKQLDPSAEIYVAEVRVKQVVISNDEG